jgi:DNA-directed RNA polymerase subunit RPC12/RpoP
MSSTEWFDDSTESLDDREYPDEEDRDDDLNETLPCPECGAEIYEEAQRCPHCGSYIVFSTRPFQGRSWWWIALGILAVVAVVVMLAIAGSC